MSDLERTLAYCGLYLLKYLTRKAEGGRRARMHDTLQDAFNILTGEDEADTEGSHTTVEGMKEARRAVFRNPWEEEGKDE